MKFIWAVGFFILTTFAARADKFVPLTVTITAKAYVEAHGNGGAHYTNINPANVYSLTTKSLLSAISTDAFFDGYRSNSFPIGAKIVLMFNVNDYNQSYFEVVDSAGFPVFDASPYLKISFPSENSVQSGYLDTDTGLLTNYKQMAIGVISFDETFSASPGSHDKFYLSGVFQIAGTDSVPKNSAYTEKWSLKMTGSGSGEDIGVVFTEPMIITGTVSMTGSKVFPVQ